MVWSWLSFLLLDEDKCLGVKRSFFGILTKLMVCKNHWISKWVCD